MHARRIKIFAGFGGFGGLCLAFALALGAALSTAAGAARAGDETPFENLAGEDKAAFERLVREYLLANPDVIVEALDAYRERRQTLTEAMRAAALEVLAQDVREDPMLPQAGAPGGDVTLIEFFDYRCGYCKRAFPAVQELIKTDGGIRYVLKEFPILGPQSAAASEFALAVWLTDPERYFGFHDTLMTLRGGLPASRLRAAAADAGIDVARTEAALDDPKIAAAIRRTHEQAEALGINGTPAFVIGDTVVSGVRSPEEMREIIAMQRQRGQRRQGE